MPFVIKTKFIEPHPVSGVHSPGRLFQVFRDHFLLTVPVTHHRLQWRLHSSIQLMLGVHECTLVT